MKTYVITVARGFGSGGKRIALMLAKRLGIPCYESQILTMASEYSGINRDLFMQVDEKLRGNFLLQKLKLSPSNDAVIQPTEKGFISDTNLYNIQATVIRELARSESCVVVGKCANHVLRKHRNVLSVYVEASRDVCVRTVVERLGTTPEEAATMIEQTDRYRAEYYRFYTGGKLWTDPIAYDLTLNSGRLSYENCAALIQDCAKIKFATELP
jgi:cytidylate kinase